MATNSKVKMSIGSWWQQETSSLAGTGWVVLAPAATIIIVYCVCCRMFCNSSNNWMYYCNNHGYLCFKTDIAVMAWVNIMRVLKSKGFLYFSSIVCPMSQVSLWWWCQESKEYQFITKISRSWNYPDYYQLHIAEQLSIED